jgi:hypothetical protein
VSDLSIPDVTGLNSLDAAQAYAAVGLYLLPVPLREKHPGLIVGKGWPEKSSCDPNQINKWFGCEPLNIALHAGRSGAVIADIDHPENVPDVLRAEILNARPPALQTRDVADNGLVRGHYLFAQPEGRRIGNSTGELGVEWGEVRGTNGVIIVPPSIHKYIDGGDPKEPDLPGFYKWLRTGPLPTLGPSIADLLQDSDEEGGEASDEEVRKFLSIHTASANGDHYLKGLISSYQTSIDKGAGHHDTAFKVACWAYREAAAGLVNASTVYQELGRTFAESVDRPVQREWNNITKSAIKKALAADPEVIRMRHPELRLQLAPAPGAQDNERPKMSEDAFYGPIGELVRLLEPCLEADPVFLLASALTGIGCILGDRLTIHSGPAPQNLNLFITLVGDTSSGKGASWGVMRRRLKVIDEKFFGDKSRNEIGGMGSGEILIKITKDRETDWVYRKDEKGKLIKFPKDEHYAKEHGDRIRHADPRLLISEEEWARMMKNTQRKDSQLSPILREAWGNKPLYHAASSSGGETKVARHHVSIFGHITPEELFDVFTGLEMANGFGNRFLWFAGWKARDVPLPLDEFDSMDFDNLPTEERVIVEQLLAEMPPLDEDGVQVIANEIADSLEKVQKVGDLRVRLRPSAAVLFKDLRKQILPNENDSALFRGMANRADVQLLRVAAIFALIDGNMYVHEKHLRAAYAFVKYSNDTIRYLWKDKVTADLHSEGGKAVDNLGQQLLDALAKVKEKGMSKLELRDAVKRNNKFDMTFIALLNQKKIVQVKQGRSLRIYLTEFAPVEEN